MTSTSTTGGAPVLRPVRTTRWTSGFWGGIAARTAEITVPRMGERLHDASVSPAWRNFRIAAGLETGEHDGPPFMDGDFYKWLEAAISELETAPTPQLAATVDEAAGLIRAIQRDDGYVHTPTLIAARREAGAAELGDRFAFETYNIGHLITAGVRHYEVTGRTELLDVAERAAGFLEHLAADRPDDLARSAICPSHYMAVIELYRATGADRYLHLAERFLQVRDDFHGGDDNQDRLPVREQRVAAGHAVRANYLYAGLADLVAETGDQALQDVLERLWDDVVSTKISVTGGCGALYDGASPDASPWQEEISRVHQAYGRPYQLPNTTAHNETCAQIGMLLWSERMLALTADAKYADVIEQIALNSMLSGIALSGDAFCYTNPLRQVRDLPFALRRPGDTGLHPVPTPPASDARVRRPYLSCFCCPPNLARTLARFHERAASVSPDGLFVHQYGGSDIRVEAPNAGTLHLEEHSDYPWNGRIVFTVREAAGRGMPVHLRVPGWAHGATLTAAGTSYPAPPGRYARIERGWHVGDTIELVLPMPVRMLRGHRLAEEITNQAAVARGPIVYCVESCDLPAEVRLEQAALQRGVRPRPVEGEIDGHHVVVLEADLAVLPPVSPDALYDDLPDDAPGRVHARLIPYFAWGNRGPSEMSVWMPVVW